MLEDESSSAAKMTKWRSVVLRKEAEKEGKKHY